MKTKHKHAYEKMRIHHMQRYDPWTIRPEVFGKFIKEILRLVKKGKIKKSVQLIYRAILRLIYQLLPHEGIKVLEEDWDYLIILDACRYDVFEEINTIPGRLEKKKSLASNTWEWLMKNFPGYYQDIVYVSPNPHISSIAVKGFKGTQHFYRVLHVWKFGWDEELSTVPPREVTKATLRARLRYPNKRLIIHYIQPHAPWIGETRVSNDEVGLTGKWIKTENLNLNYELIRKAYRDNLRLVLGEVKKLVYKLEGKIVVTSDHGECFGEKFIIEHPLGIYIKELVEIPWLVIDKCEH